MNTLTSRGWMVPAASGSLQIKLGWVATKQEPFGKKIDLLIVTGPFGRGSGCLGERLGQGRHQLTIDKKDKRSLRSFTVSLGQEKLAPLGPERPSLPVVTSCLVCFLLCRPGCYVFQVKLSGKHTKEHQRHHSRASPS